MSAVHDPGNLYDTQMQSLNSNSGWMVSSSPGVTQLLVSLYQIVRQLLVPLGHILVSLCPLLAFLLQEHLLASNHQSLKRW